MNNNEFGLKRFIFSRFLGTLCDQFLLFAVPLTILQVTGSLMFASLAFVIEWVPRLIFFPLSGFIADRVNPRSIFFNVEIGRALLMLIVFLVLFFEPTLTFPALATMMALLSVAYVLNFVSTESLLPRNIPAEELPKALSMVQGVDQVTQVLGPTLAAIIAVYGGINTILVVAGALFAISAINYLFLKSRQVSVGDKLSFKSLIDSNKQGAKVLWKNKVLLHLCGLTWVVNLIYGAALVVSAAVILEEFRLPERYFGILQSSAAIATIVAFFFVPRFVRRFGLSTLGTISFCAMILAGTLMTASVYYALYLVGYMLLMAFDGVFSVYLRSVRSQIIPQEHLGKTTGLIGLINMSSVPASGVAVTFLASYFRPLEIIGIILVFAFILGIVLIVLGRRAFGYKSWLPPVITTE
ncbi:MFS transporter [Xenorhabdus nematophila]|uniref:MFS transporter n=3 Tax=Xenorhabdus nematophila TaxID=628 RepID=UPI0003275341|nr:MFS transporter [Xenorhabdus nematophila]CEF32639.1 Major Facilitator Superfamily transporter [Xenorhabdus nematophila str. Websteri]AYA41120.1 MFS transporter [Xenorhabdus nematophila]KHD27662.1 SetB [Xenorhabdus nematophila]MBA0019869.1 MFS transporter [Xenorhabdus nematophila]MCB4426717.1 MFS transporter [Xenorhabdus nematophila]